MKAIKLIDTETIETSNVFNLEGGPVTVIEREVHEFYRLADPSGTRLIIEEAIGKTKNFIARSREEFSELSSVLRELTAK